MTVVFKITKFCDIHIMTLEDTTPFTSYFTFAGNNSVETVRTSELDRSSYHLFYCYVTVDIDNTSLGMLRSRTDYIYFVFSSLIHFLRSHEQAFYCVWTYLKFSRRCEWRFCSGLWRPVHSCVVNYQSFEEAYLSIFNPEDQDCVLPKRR